MKRSLLQIVLSLLLFTFGTISGQEIRLKAIIGDVVQHPGAISLGNLIFDFEYVFGGTETQSVSNGFKIHSPDGALWGASILDNSFLQSSLTEFDGNLTSGTLSNDGQLADTAFLIGQNLSGLGIPPGVVRSVTRVTVVPTLSSDRKHLCIDSCWFPPSGDWSWSDAGGSVPVEWGGGVFAPQYSDGSGYCFELTLESPTVPVITNCPPSLSYDHCKLATYDFDASDPDGDPTLFAIVSGPGSINQNTGVWTYSPTLADVGTTPQLVISASDMFGTGSYCSVDLNFTNVAPTMTTGCGDLRLTYAGYPATADFGASSRDCDLVTYSLVSMVPVPVGSYSINSSTGVVTFTPHAMDGGYIFTVTVCASDGMSSSCCSAEFVLVCCDPPICGNIDGDLQEQINVVDVTRLVNYLFAGGSQPNPLDIADVNCSPANNVNVVDLTYLVSYLFGGGPAPCAGC